MRKKSSPGLLSNCLLLEGLLIKNVPFSLQVLLEPLLLLLLFFLANMGAHNSLSIYLCPQGYVFILPKKVLKAVGR